MNQDPSVPKLDPEALARLNELDPDGRHGVVVRVLAAFDKSLTRLLEQLAGPAAGSGTLADLAHTLKSSSASVGALPLSRACAEIEARQRAGDSAALGADTARLIAEARAAQQAVRAILRP